MSQGIHYPILINPPKEVCISFEQFDKLSCIGLASFFCNYEYVVEKKEDEYVLYMMEGHQYRFVNQKRFEGLNWYIYPTVEMLCCKIPIENPLIKTIEKYFSHLILK